MFRDQARDPESACPKHWKKLPDGLQGRGGQPPHPAKRTTFRTPVPQTRPGGVRPAGSSTSPACALAPLRRRGEADECLVSTRRTELIAPSLPAPENHLLASRVGAWPEGKDGRVAGRARARSWNPGDSGAVTARLPSRPSTLNSQPPRSGRA